MTEERVGKMIYVWGDPTFVISNFDPLDGHTLYAPGSVAITMHYEDGFEKAGSLSHDRAFYVDDLQIPDLIAALREFLPEGNQ